MTQSMVLALMVIIFSSVIWATYPNISFAFTMLLGSIDLVCFGYLAYMLWPK